MLASLPHSEQPFITQPFITYVHEAADLLFEQRYGWPAGKAKNMTLEQLWIALEYALGDKANDPKGIWKLTR